MSAAWHASTVHALVTAGRDYLAERREDVADLVEWAKEYALLPTRFDVLTSSYGRTLSNLRDLATIVSGHGRRLKIVESRYPASDLPARNAIEDLERRVKALETNVDKGAW